MSYPDCWDERGDRMQDVKCERAKGRKRSTRRGEAGFPADMYCIPAI